MRVRTRRKGRKRHEDCSRAACIHRHCMYSKTVQLHYMGGCTMLPNRGASHACYVHVLVCG